MCVRNGTPTAQRSISEHTTHRRWCRGSCCDRQISSVAHTHHAYIAQIEAQLRRMLPHPCEKRNHLGSTEAQRHRIHRWTPTRIQGRTGAIEMDKAVRTSFAEASRLCPRASAENHEPLPADPRTVGTRTATPSSLTSIWMVGSSTPARILQDTSSSPLTVHRALQIITNAKYQRPSCCRVVGRELTAHLRSSRSTIRSQAGGRRVH